MLNENNELLESQNINIPAEVIFKKSLDIEYNKYKNQTYENFPIYGWFTKEFFNESAHRSKFKTNYMEILNSSYRHYENILQKCFISTKDQLMSLKRKSHVWLGELRYQDPFARMYWVIQDALYYYLSIKNQEMHKVNLMFMEFFENKKETYEYDTHHRNIFNYHSIPIHPEFKTRLLEYNEKYLDEIEFSPIFTMFLYPITLTEFGKNNILSIIDVFGKKMDEYYIQNSITLLRYNFNKYKVRDLDRMKTFKSEIKMLSTESENTYRENKNLPRIGENWIEETLLYYKIKEEFLSLLVIQHGRPDFLGQQHYDIWIPKKKIAIEYQGEQHFRPVDYFGGEEAYLKQLERDNRKKEISSNNGITLIYVSKGYNFIEIVEKIKKLSNVTGTSPNKR